MCLITTKDANLKIADKPIRCYKALIRVSLFKYRPIIYLRFRYVRWKKTPYVYIFKKKRGDMCMVERGYHSYREQSGAAHWTLQGTSIKMYLCEIPAGAEYYMSIYGHEYVSSQLRVIKRIR